MVASYMSRKYQHRPSNGSLSSMALPSSIVYSSTESNPINTSSSDHSSGRSTPSFKKRPKRPNIQLSNHTLYQDYVEIRRTGSICSLNSDYSESLHSENSYLDISDDFIANTILTSQFNAIPGAQNGDTLHEFEKTLQDTVSNPTVDIESTFIGDICIQRPESPTSKFLMPILSSDTELMMTELHRKLSPMLHKIKKLEEKCSKMSSLQVKLAVLQEEKRQLSAMLKNKRHTSGESVGDTEEPKKKKNLKQSEIFQTTHMGENVVKVDKGTSVDCDNTLFKDAAVQKYLEIVTEISHKYTSTDDFNKEKYCTKATQHTPNQNSISTQSNRTQHQDKCSMAGASSQDIVDVGTGNNIADILFIDQEIQSDTICKRDQTTECSVCCHDEAVSVGCSVNDLKNISVQVATETKDFSCGEGFLEVSDKSTFIAPVTSDCSINTDLVQISDACVSCDIQKDSKTIAVGDGKVSDVICDECLNKNTVSIATGMYINSDPCCTDDKLCDCFKPEYKSIGVSINNICCDKCEYLRVTSTGVGDHRINDLLCDRCENIETRTVGSSSDKINDVLCQVCAERGEYVDKGVGEDRINDLSRGVKSVGVGNKDVNEIDCEKCLSNKDNMFNFDMNILNASQQQAVLCHYCGNKVDLNDTKLDESLQAMRDSMQSISSNMKRSSVSRSLNLDLDHDDSQLYTQPHLKDCIESPSDDYHHLVSDEEDEDTPR